VAADLVRSTDRMDAVEVTRSPRRLQDVAANVVFTVAGVCFVGFSVIVLFQLWLPAGGNDLPGYAQTPIRIVAFVAGLVGLGIALGGLIAPGRFRWAASNRLWISIVDLIAIVGLAIAVLAVASAISVARWDGADAIAKEVHVSEIGMEVVHDQYGGRSFGSGDAPTVDSTRVCSPAAEDCARERAALSGRLRAADFVSADSIYWRRVCGSTGTAVVFITDQQVPGTSGNRPALKVSITTAGNYSAGKTYCD
jgi:hypothetical protein